MFSRLTHDEKLALVGAIKWLTLSDLRTTPGETAYIDRVARELGDEEYHRLFNEVDEKFPAIEGFQEFLAGVGSGESRRLIFDFLVDYAEADAADLGEAADLQWLARTWNLE
ncbi:MAG TPA: hypothetical protein PK636_05355 [bacterium]|nr:hypothetical protein [bacterium]HPJ72091.1 hypothetical protein [bacterium]